MTLISISIPCYIITNFLINIFAATPKVLIIIKMLFIIPSMTVIILLVKLLAATRKYTIATEVAG